MRLLDRGGGLCYDKYKIFREVGELDMWQKYDRAQVAETLQRWERILQEYRLPAWEELPRLELYMDQVVSLLKEYLAYLSEPEENFITPMMINSYVKQKLIPPPVKKRYSRQHLACLIMLWIFKQTLSVADAGRLLPSGGEAEVERAYTGFVETYRLLGPGFAQYIRDCTGGTFDKVEEEEVVESLLMQAAVTATHAKLLTVRLTRLGPASAETKEK